MGSQINELVKMRDVESLYEVMAEDSDWMTQLDAAEGLVKLGDRRGLEFLLNAQHSDDEEARAVAKEILDSPALEKMREEIKAEDAREYREKVAAAKKRLASGRKVYRYMMIYLPAGELLDEDPLGAGFELPALDVFGLEGWEVVNIIPRRRQVLTGSVDDHFSGAYFLLKKELAPDESAELDVS